jgi:DNA polymerase-3 subunit beta
VTRVQGVVERKSTMPVLSNVLLNATASATGTPEGGSLRLSATDMYLAIQGNLNAEVKQAGTVAVSARDLLERVKMMPEGPIQIVTTDGSNTMLRAAGSARRFTLRGLPGEDFPPLPVPAPGAPSLALEVNTLQQLMGTTYYAVSTDETRADLNSALFEWDGECVRMVATDGHRLAKTELRVPGRTATATMLLPLKAISELRRLCDELATDKDAKDATIQITQSGSNAFFQAGATTFSVRLVDAHFPPYAQVIPQLSNKRMRASRVALADALRAVSIAASERTGGVRLSVSTNEVRITSESAETGDGFDQLPVEYTGEPMQIGFNARYFLDVLNVLDEDEVDILLSGELDPSVIKPASDRNFIAVVMPMRI